MCHMSRVPCHVSCVTCYVAPVTCHFFFITNWLSKLVEGLLSTGPTPSSFKQVHVPGWLLSQHLELQSPMPVFPKPNLHFPVFTSFTNRSVQENCNPD